MSEKAYFSFRDQNGNNCRAVPKRSKIKVEVALNARKQAVKISEKYRALAKVITKNDKTQQA